MSNPAGEPAPDRGGAYTYGGAVHWEYSPELDHDPDPGEIVWTWVAFEDDSSIGKDRPVAVVGRTDDGRLAALMLSSKEHDGDRGWISIGAGPWDKAGRESWVRQDRILAVPAAAVRREGAVLPRATYDVIVSGVRSSSHRPMPTPTGPTPQRKPSSAQTSGFLARLRALFRRNG